MVDPEKSQVGGHDNDNNKNQQQDQRQPGNLQENGEEKVDATLQQNVVTSPSGNDRIDGRRKRKDLVRTQFGDLPYSNRHLAIPYFAALTDEKIAEIVESEEFQNSLLFKNARVNYFRADNRDGIVSFENLEFDAKTAIAQLGRHLRRKQRLPRHDISTLSNEMDHQREKADANMNSEGSYVTNSNAAHMDFLKRLDMKLDKTIQRNADFGNNNGTGAKQYWKGWTIQRVVKRKKNIAALLQKKVDDFLDRRNGTAPSPESNETHPIVNDQDQKVTSQNKLSALLRKNAITSPIQSGKFGSSKRKMTKWELGYHVKNLKEAATEALEAAKRAEREADAKLNSTRARRTSSQSNGKPPKYLARKSRAVHLKTHIPETVKKRHPKVKFPMSRNEKLSQHMQNKRRKAKGLPPKQTQTTTTRRRSITTANQEAQKAIQKRKLIIHENELLDVLLERQLLEAAEVYSINRLWSEPGVDDWVELAFENGKQNIEQSRPRPKSAPKARQQIETVASEIEFANKYRVPTRPNTARVDTRERPKFSTFLKAGSKKPSTVEKPPPTPTTNVVADDLKIKKEQMETRYRSINDRVEEDLDAILKFVHKSATPSEHVLFPHSTRQKNL